jgi:Uma2 family endonuclease
MATQSRALHHPAHVNYPTRDGKPVGETPVHRDILFELVYQLRRRFEADPMTYVSGNMMMYDVEGDKRRHVSPDVFVTLGILDDGRRRDAYFVWQEGKGPDFVVELTSKSTRREDQGSKLALYRDVLKVREYFLFDPYGEYLKPPLKGFRLVEGRYDPIDPVEGRLPSEVVGLNLEAVGEDLLLYDPALGRYLPLARDLQTTIEQIEAERDHATAEAERLRREVEELRRRLVEEGN